MKENKSIKINAILNVIRSCLSVIFPLITYPYVMRVIGATGLGKVSYVSSIVGYFSLLAMLGVSSYAVREGANIKRKTKQFKQFVSEVFTINFIFTIFAYILLFIVVLSIKNLHNYEPLFVILGASIIFQTFSVDWVNTIFEDYLYITIRSIILYLLNACIMFLWIKSEEDYIKYAVLQVLPSGIICVLNWIYCRKYVKISLTRNPNFRKHLKPLVILFVNSLMVSIYVNFDTTMLGWLKGDYYVGLYTAAVKVYGVVKGILIAIYAVVIPRLALFYGEKKIDQFRNLYTKLWCYLSLLLIPMGIGLACLSKEIILIMGGKTYVNATPSLQVLAVALVFAIFGGLLTTCLNVTIGREKENLKATIISAVINGGLNFVFIPIWGHTGAALTTLISELFVLVYSIIKLPNITLYLETNNVLRNLRQVIIGSTGIIIWAILIKQWTIEIIPRIILTVLGASLIYILALMILRNEYVIELIKKRKRNKDRNRIKD